jgi:hypothetical protein
MRILPNVILGSIAFAIVLILAEGLFTDTATKPSIPDTRTKIPHNTGTCQKLVVEGTTCVYCTGTFSENMALSCDWRPQ